MADNLPGRIGAFERPGRSRQPRPGPLRRRRFTLAAARRVATDIAPDMAAFAAQRPAATVMRNVVAHEMHAEAIDLPDASVDAVICRRVKHCAVHTR
jgi:hypothetical protein